MDYEWTEEGLNGLGVAPFASDIACILSRSANESVRANEILTRSGLTICVVLERRSCSPSGVSHVQTLTIFGCHNGKVGKRG